MTKEVRLIRRRLQDRKKSIEEQFSLHIGRNAASSSCHHCNQYWAAIAVIEDALSDTTDQPNLSVQFPIQ